MLVSAQIKRSTSLSALFLLAACFVSEEPLIPIGEAVLPIDYALTLCPDRPNNCTTLISDGDTYRTAPDVDPNETGTARFYPIAQAEGRQVFLLEAYDTDDDAFTYLLARRRTPDAIGDADLDLALVSCSDLTNEEEDWFRANGGEISSGWGSECRAPDLQTLIVTLRRVYHDDLADEDWWTGGGAD